MFSREKTPKPTFRIYPQHLWQIVNFFLLSIKPINRGYAVIEHCQKLKCKRCLFLYEAVYTLSKVFEIKI